MSEMSVSDDEDVSTPQRFNNLKDPSEPRTNLDLINECDNFPYYEKEATLYQELQEEYFAFFVAGQPSIFGYMLPQVAGILNNVPGWYFSQQDRSLTLNSGPTREERSDLVAKTCIAMRETQAFEVLRGWRDELYPVYADDGQILFEVERSASCLFGVVTYGCHMTAYVKSRGAHGEEQMRIWVPRRSPHKQTYGGMLDNTVAGGIAVGETAFESLVRECAEEASLPENVVRQGAKSAGVVTYFHVRDHRAGGEVGLLQPECQYVFDLELSEDVVLKPGDNEVSEFTLMTIQEVQQAMAQGQFKPNCALVLIDFFMRHGILTQQNERDYLEINARLHRLLEFPVARS